MYDPARDIFTESQPSSSPPVELYELSALDTLAGLAAEAQIASIPVKQEKTEEPVKQDVNSVIKEEHVQKNGTAEEIVQDVVPVSEVTDDGIVSGGGGGAEVARTKGPEMSLKVTLHLKKPGNKKITESTQIDENGKSPLSDGQGEDIVKKDDIQEYRKVESPDSPMKEVSPTKVELKQESPKQQSPEQNSPKKQERATPEETRNDRSDRNDHAYPIPLSLAKLSKIPKRKAEDRDSRPPKESTNKDRRPSRPQSPSRLSRSPQYRPRSPGRRLSDDRYRPNQLIDSYRPSRDRDDHYPLPKRPRSPSPPRQLKRPVRKDISATDRERERRERQFREEERQRADLEMARSRPIYEAVRQHYNDREDRGREARQESRIFKLRKFNNWIKSVLIAKFIPDRTEEEVDEGRGLFVLDIGCGKGGDLGKWQKQPQIQAYVGVDVAEVSVMHAEQRAAELRGRRFSTRFFAMDCFVVNEHKTLTDMTGSDTVSTSSKSSPI